MAKDFTSIRYGRLTDIMQLLEAKISVTRDELYRTGSYSSLRTLQNDPALFARNMGSSYQL